MNSDGVGFKKDALSITSEEQISLFNSSDFLLDQRVGNHFTIHLSDLFFYLAMVAFMNLMNRESFHENIAVRKPVYYKL